MPDLDIPEELLPATSDSVATSDPQLPAATSDPPAEQNPFTVNLVSSRLAAVNASRRERLKQTEQETAQRAQPTRWLRSTTASATSEVARKLIDQATQEYEAHAWLSAETSAWDALQWAAEAVELNHRELRASGEEPIGAVQRLKLARQIIREARDFSGKYGLLDGEAIARMARSHVTDVLDNRSTEGLTATDAADLYLDEARVLLAPIAARSVEAAQAMDLLAAIYLNRADADTLPSATAICLRRAALQGQPRNASLATKLGLHLAEVGLFDEARWALERATSLQPTTEATEALVQVLLQSGHDQEASRLVAAMQFDSQRNGMPQTRMPGPRIPEITQLSPEQFAALSQPVMQSPIHPGAAGDPTMLASPGTNLVPAQPMPAARPPGGRPPAAVALPASAKLNIVPLPPTREPIVPPTRAPIVESHPMQTTPARSPSNAVRPPAPQRSAMELWGMPTTQGNTTGIGGARIASADRQGLPASARGTPAMVASAKRNVVSVPPTRDPIVETSTVPRSPTNAKPISSGVSVPQPPAAEIAQTPAFEQHGPPQPLEIDPSVRPLSRLRPEPAMRLDPRARDVPFGQFEQLGMFERLFKGFR